MTGRESESVLREMAHMLHIKLLSDIKRYEGKEMVHRTDLFIHILRTGNLVKVLGHILNTSPKYSFDLDKLGRMGLQHDDAELITGDIVAPIKRTLSPEAKVALEAREEQGVHALASFLYGFTDQKQQEHYLKQQEEIDAKKTPEAQLLDVADKWDAVGEIVHDIRCGNEAFISLLPFSQQVFERFQEYPFWKELSKSRLLEFGQLRTGVFMDYVTLSKRLSIDDLPTRESVSTSMDSNYYPDWPQAYRLWAQLSRDTFTIQPEKYIFPGWYLDLWKQWKYYPTGSSTLSGIRIP